MREKVSVEERVREIRRKTRKKYSAEEKVRIVSWTSVLSVAAVPVIGLMWIGLPAVQAQSSGLFSTNYRAPAQLDLPRPASLDATTLRRRVVTMDLGQLQRAQAAAAPLDRSPVDSNAVSPRSDDRDAVPASDATLTLNLFEDVVLTAIVERTAPTFSGGYSISGRLEGEPLGTLAFVVNGETVAGSVRTLGGTYRIWSVGGGLFAISEVEEPPLNCGVEEPPCETDVQP